MAKVGGRRAGPRCYSSACGRAACTRGSRAHTTSMNSNLMETRQTKESRFERSLPGERFPIGAILFVTGLLYASTLSFAFVYDDHGQIAENALLGGWRFVPQYFRGQ